MKPKKLSKVEKVMLGLNNDGTYVNFRCGEHGLIQVHKDKALDTAACVYCKKECPRYAVA